MEVKLAVWFRLTAQPHPTHRQVRFTSSHHLGEASSSSNYALSMAYNNAYLIKSLAHQTTTAEMPPSAAMPEHPPQHAIEPSVLVLPTALPLTSELEVEARKASVAELKRQSEELERERQLAEALIEEHHRQERREVVESQGTWTKLIAGTRKGKNKTVDPVEQEGKTKGFDRPPNAYELYAAIDRKDIMYVSFTFLCRTGGLTCCRRYIMRVRDHAFPLLLQKNAGEFPIVYASRIGKSHQGKYICCNGEKWVSADSCICSDIAILICGALSRYERADFGIRCWC